MKNRWVFWGLIILMLTQNDAFASKKKIEALKKTIANEQRQKAKLQANIQQEDQAVNTIKKKLRSTNLELKKHNRQVQKLTKETRTLSHAIDEQKQQIAEKITLTYKLKQQPTLRVILDHRPPHDLARTLKYLQTLNHESMTMIQAMHSSIEQLQATENQMLTYKKALESTKRKQRQTQKSLEKAKQLRENKLKAITQSIANKQKALEQMKKDNRALENVVAKVSPKKDQKDLAQFSPHSMPWPCKGKVTQHFGKSIQNSGLKTQGIVIEGDEGDPIYAIAAGKVVFADWLSGFGLLAIIEHHNGHLSLYGRNDSLDVEVGEIIHQGDKIASMGKSGAFEKNGLYFAIRKGDKPIDPEQLLN